MRVLVTPIRLEETPPGPAPSSINYEAILERTRGAAHRHGLNVDMLVVQLVATAAAVALLLACYWLILAYRTRRLRRFLRGLPDASTDGSWLVIAYEWGEPGQAQLQSGRMPLDSIGSMTELTQAAVEYGADAVDADIRLDNSQFHYMDLRGVERRVGGKTPFAVVKHARVLRLSKKPTAPAAEQVGLMGAGRGRLKHKYSLKHKRRAPLPTVGEGAGALDNDDMSMISGASESSALDLEECATSGVMRC